MKIPFFCINLKNRIDRWNCVKKNKKYINFERFEAICIKDKPRLSCALSHKGIIKIAKKRHYEYVWIFEDDVSFSDGNKFTNYIQKSILELPKDWSILYLGGLIWRNGSIKKYSKNLVQVNGFMCTYGIIYNKTFYGEIIKNINIEKDTIDWYRAIDNWLAEKVQLNYRCFCTKKLLVHEATSFSSIEGRIKNTKMIYALRFSLYKNWFRWICIILWKIWDFLWFSNKARQLRIDNKTQKK